MPVATPEQYAEMLDKAKANGYAYPAINAASSQSINAILQGLTEAGSDGIIQVTTGGADYFAGHTVKGRATGAIAFAKFATEVAKNYPVTVALHTDHCPKPALEDFVLPLIAASEEEVEAGRNPIFQSHMWDGSAVPLDENIEIAKELLPRLKAINAILEVEIGVVGGEEDGVKHEGSNEALYTTTADVSKFVDALGLGENGRYIAALTFGNVHGVYKPGNVKLRPEVLQAAQAAAAAELGLADGSKPFHLVFHGGSGSLPEEIAAAVDKLDIAKLNELAAAPEVISNTEQAAAAQGQRNTVMNGSFLRASLFSSVIAYGVSALVMGLGVMFLAIGFAFQRLAAAPAAATRADTV